MLTRRAKAYSSSGSIV